MGAGGGGRISPPTIVTVTAALLLLVGGCVAQGPEHESEEPGFKARKLSATGGLEGFSGGGRNARFQASAFRGGRNFRFTPGAVFQAQQASNPNPVFRDKNGRPFTIDPRTGDIVPVEQNAPRPVRLQQGAGLQFDPVTGRAFTIDPITGQQRFVDPVTGLPLPDQGVSPAGGVPGLQFDPVTLQAFIIDQITGQRIFVDPTTGQPLPSQIPAGQVPSVQFDPVTGQSFTIDPLTGARVIVDPITGQPFQQPGIPPPGQFDPITGQPINIDPTTGLPFNQPIGQSQLGFGAIQGDPTTGRAFVLDPFANQPIFIGFNPGEAQIQVDFNTGQTFVTSPFTGQQIPLQVGLDQAVLQRVQQILRQGNDAQQTQTVVELDPSGRAFVVDQATNQQIFVRVVDAQTGRDVLG